MTSQIVRRTTLICAFVGFAILLTGLPAQAQFGGAFGRQSVGGIMIDANGVIRDAGVETRVKLRDELLKRHKQPAGDINQPVGLRMISLKGLEAAIADAHKNANGKLDEEIMFLAGLQRIEYVLLYPKENDIVLAGPGEGWRVNENGSVVGVTTGRPVMVLDDLLVALRTVKNAREGGLSCSIDPTQEGRVNLNRFLKANSKFSPQLMDGMREALGTQKITLQGIPTDSHFAQVLVAADYQMKRIAMKLTPSPVKGIPSFLTMLENSKKTKFDNIMPRWWLATNYEPLLRSEDGLTWQIRGQGVKAMTEDDFIDLAGNVKNTGRKSPIAQKWADAMTEHYGELSKESAVFGELRNVMDMSVIAALINKEGMLAKVGLDLPLLMGATSELKLEHWNVPTGVSTQCSFIHVSNQNIVTASGGVQIDSWQVAQNSMVGASVEKTRSSAPAYSTKSWWWQ